MQLLPPIERGLRQCLVDRAHQAGHVGFEPVRAQFDGVPSDQSPQAVGQLLALGHWCSTNEDRDYPHIAAQRGLDLKAHEVVGVVEPPLSSLIDDVQPAVTDEGQQHLAGADRILEDPDKVVARFDGVDVLENQPVAHMCAQPVIKPARRERRVVAPVADKDTSRSRRGGPRRHGVKNAT